MKTKNQKQRSKNENHVTFIEDPLFLKSFFETINSNYIFLLKVYNFIKFKFNYIYIFHILQSRAS